MTINSCITPECQCCQNIPQESASLDACMKSGSVAL